MTLTVEADLDSIQVNQHAKYLGQGLTGSEGTLRTNTHTHTHTHTHIRSTVLLGPLKARLHDITGCLTG